MTNEMREILDLLAANEERGKALSPLAETAEQTEIDAREAELNAIAEERASLEAKKVQLENEERAAQEVAKNPATATEIENKRGEMAMTNEEIRNSKEYIDAFADAIRKQDDKFSECRALLTENVDSGTIPVPTVVYDIIKNAWERNGVMRRVRKSYLKGNIKVGFEISADGAVIHTEGAAAVSEENLVLGVVEIIPTSIKKWVSVSDEALDLRGEEFLRYIYDELTYRIAKKAEDETLAKIISASTASTATAVGLPIYTATTVSVGITAQAMALLSDQASDLVIVMNKASWGNFKAAQSANKYNYDPFEGLPVEFNNSIKSFDAASSGDTYMIIGDFGEGALANFPNGEDITIKVDDKTLMAQDLVKILGRQYVGIGIVGPDAFVRVQK